MDRRRRSRTGAAPSGAQRCAARRPYLPNFAALAALALAAHCAGCVTLAPENSNVAPATKTLHIQVDKALPKVIETYMFTPGTPVEFRVNGALLQANISQQLTYIWLADFDAAAGLPVYLSTVKSCIFAESSCKVDFCTLEATTENVHRIRLVVADGRLKSTAISPLDFPTGTAFDSIEWRVKINGACK
ncbi:MAG: hypothetical protein HY902_08315 [Deltaproteobacteria bacterium]|nr:hypothetical protein [Deltaproteobacteria bacterium]